MQIITTIVPWILSFFSLVVAAITIQSNAKMHYFDVYFQQKVNSYRNFFAEAFAFSNGKISVSQLLAACYEASLFCSNETACNMDNVIYCLNDMKNGKEYQNPLDLIEKVNLSMRADLEKDHPQSRLWTITNRKNQNNKG